MGRMGAARAFQNMDSCTFGKERHLLEHMMNGSQLQKFGVGYAPPSTPSQKRGLEQVH